MSLQITSLVLCYCQPARAQRLARAVQAYAVGVVRLMVGELAFDAPRGARRSWRGDASARAVVSCVAGAVTHLIPYCRTRVLRTHARTAHAPTSAPLVHSTSYARAAHTLARCVTFLCFFIAYLCEVPYFCSRMTNQDTPYYIIETSLVPFGHEPTVVFVEPSYEKALETLEFLKLEYPSECYEMIEA